MIGTTTAMVEMIAGLGWDPEIRGLLTVVLGFAVLGGSVWLLLVTNTGTRLGSLIALAGFWGWMFCMGVFWWIYGIGWVGSAPTWEVQDVFADPAGYEAEGISEAFIGNVADLPDANCYNGVDSFPPVAVAGIRLDKSQAPICTPRAIDILMSYPDSQRELKLREILNPQSPASTFPVILGEVSGFVAPANGDDVAAAVEAELESLSQAQRNEVFDLLVAAKDDELAAAVNANNALLGPEDPRYRPVGSLAYKQRLAYSKESTWLRIDDMSLSALRGTAPEMVDWAEAHGYADFDGWTLQSTSQAGEAAATADEYLRSDLFPDGNFVVLDAYQQGGKDKRDGTGIWDRIRHTFTSAAQLTHPTNYTVINVQQTIDKAVDPSLPPPVAEADPEEPLYSVVLVRNLGNLRLIPGLFTVVSLILFLITCAVLHWRDLGLRDKGLDV